MAEINFGSNSQAFDRFYEFFHVSAAVLCVIMGFFALFQDGHYIYVPPIFIIATSVCGVNVYASLINYRHKKKKTGRLLALVYLITAVALGFVSYFSIKSFWL